MESRRDQFQLLEHFTSAIKDDSARPQIAQLTELGLVELTRKRQGQNIYELFGKKCSICDGTGHVEKQLNYEISNLQINNVLEKPNKSNSLKLEVMDTSTDKQEKRIEKEFLNPKNIYSEESSTKRENANVNDNDDLNTSNSKEKNIIAVDLTKDEKLVFSQLGINPLIKLGKEYLSSNNFVRLKENNTKEKSLDNKKTTVKQVKKISKSKEVEEVKISIETNSNSEDKSTKKTNGNEKVLVSDDNGEIELKDEINNARKKRRRSSANIE